MSTRYVWLFGALVLVSVGLLVACGSHFSPSSDGLLIVPSQGSAVLQAFSFALNNGRVSQINTNPAINPAPAGAVPLSVVLDPTGTFAFVAYSVPCVVGQQPPTLSAVQGAIATFKINSNGTLSASGSVFMNGNPAYPPAPQQGAPSFSTCQLDDATNPNAGNQPVAIAMDSAGKFLFVAGEFTTATSTDNTKNPPVANANLPGVISVFAIGSGGSLTEVAGSPFAVPIPLGGILPNPSALAVSPTVFPAQNAACSGQTAPTAENLYVTDEANNDVLEYAVDSSGALTLLPAQGIAAGNTPTGVAVDPCNRFVYVANHQSNNVSGYTICSKVLIPTCPSADGSLVSMDAAFSAGTGPGPMAMNPFGSFMYVVNQGSQSVSTFKIAQVTGALSPAGNSVNVGINPVSVAIRSDDNWLFVTNNASGSVSQYSITPATGALIPAGTGIITDSNPWGVAVK